jgi:hypothetical protein
MLTADPDIRHLMALRAVESGLMRLKWLAAATRFELAMVRHDRALKANFNPNEPRVPAGNPDGGQWTTGGGSAGGGSSTPRSRTDLAAVAAIRACCRMSRRTTMTSPERGWRRTTGPQAIR